jgi:hypothetical protein
VDVQFDAWVFLAIEPEDQDILKILITAQISKGFEHALQTPQSHKDHGANVGNLGNFCFNVLPPNRKACQDTVDKEEGFFQNGDAHIHDDPPKHGGNKIDGKISQEHEVDGQVAENAHASGKDTQNHGGPAGPVGELPFRPVNLKENIAKAKKRA